jgi:hypothetical protein
LQGRRAGFTARVLSQKGRREYVLLFKYQRIKKILFIRCKYENRSLSIAATKNRGRHARSLDALGTDTPKLQLLLGSTHLSHLRNCSAEYGQILTASAKFIKAVHRTRWPVGGCNARNKKRKAE